MCGACPVQSNPDVHDFACDALTGMCTCGVPEQRQTWCFSNEDCVLSETSCKLINDDQQLSTVSVSCDACQYQRMCYQTSEGGVCACGARQQHFQQCSAENYKQKQQLMLQLNNLCLYSDMVGSLEFSLVSRGAGLQRKRRLSLADVCRRSQRHVAGAQHNTAHSVRLVLLGGQRRE